MTDRLRKVANFLKRNLSLVFCALITVVITVLFVVHRKNIYAFFVQLADYVRSAGPLGVLIMVLCMVCVSFPPVPGYATILMIIGFVYGYWGFFVAYAGALVGGCCSYAVANVVLRSHKDDWIRRYPRYAAMKRAVESEGLKLVLLLRIAPYPYGIMNWVLAAAHVRFVTFFLATAGSLVKVMAHVAVGASLHSIQELTEGGGGKKNWWEIALIVVGVIFGIGVSVYVYRLTQASIAKHTYEEQVDVEGGDHGEMLGDTKDDLELEDNGDDYAGADLGVPSHSSLVSDFR